MFRRRFFKVFLALVFALVVGLFTPAAAQAAPAPGWYVGLGDSYASGVGSPPYSSDPACLRSPSAYPSLVATAIHAPTFAFTACSGALTADVLATQLTPVNRRTRLVTVSAGGNDLGFSKGVRACVAGTDADCRAVVDAGEVFARDVLSGRLDTLYAAVKQRAPRAELVVTGYPHFFETTATCPGTPLSLSKRLVLNEAVDALDATLAQRAAKSGARFADVRAAFTGHGLCGSDPWILGLTDPAAFHPTATGHREGYLPTVLAALCRRPSRPHPGAPAAT